MISLPREEIIGTKLSYRSWQFCVRHTVHRQKSDDSDTSNVLESDVFFLIADTTQQATEFHLCHSREGGNLPDNNLKPYTAFLIPVRRERYQNASDSTAAYQL